MTNFNERNKVFKVSDNIIQIDFLQPNITALTNSDLTIQMINYTYNMFDIESDSIFYHVYNKSDGVWSSPFIVEESK
jgi:translation elongation factor P/translation initiation factor 5A